MGRKRGAKNYGPWWRKYATILDDPKLSKLTHEQYRLNDKLQALATIKGGVIADDIRDIAFRLRCPEGKVREVLQVLISAELLDRIDGGYVPHNWTERQFDSDVSTDRVKAFRDKKRNDNETPVKRFNIDNETAPDTDSEAKTESEKKEDSAPQADAPKRSVKTKLPDNFPGPVELLKAREAWNEIARADLKPSLEAQKFRDHHLSHASKMADWAAAWRTWIGNAPKFTRKENFTNKRGSHVEGVHAAAELIAEFRAGEPGTDHRPDRSLEGPLLAPGDDDGPIEESVARVLPRFGGAH